MCIVVRPYILGGQLEKMRMLTVRLALPHVPKPVIEGLKCEFALQSELNGTVMLSTGSSPPKSSSVTSTIIRVQPVGQCVR